MNTLLAIFASVLLAWDASPSPNVASYHLYSAKSPELTNWTRSEPILGLQGRVDGLVPGQKYRFYVTAANIYGESLPSDWLEWAPPPKVPFLTYDHLGVYVHGDPDYSYTVEYSTNLVDWVPVAVLKGNGSGPVPFTGKGTGFFRARS
jgi:hypothetical protein